MLNKRENIQINVRSYNSYGNAITTANVLGYTYKGLALHCLYGSNPKDGFWSLTHIASGNRVFTFHDFDIIKDFMKELANNFDFTVSEDKLDKSKLRDYINNNFKYQRMPCFC